MKLKLRKNNRGFALLFSVLISSLLLTIGLSIFSIALKELAISTASRQSIHAFFAADSGREYILYRDIIQNDILKVDTTLSSFSATSTTFSGVVVSGETDGPNFEVTITKSKASSTAKINATVVSKGYDSNNDDKVERAIEQNY